MNIFENVILNKLNNDKSLLEKRFKRSMFKIDRFDLQVSSTSIENKYRKYVRLYDKMLSIQSKMLIVEKKVLN